MPNAIRNLFLVVFVFAISGCAASHQYLRPEDTKHVYNKPYQEVFQAVPVAVKSAKMVLIEVREAEGVVDVVAPPSFWTSSLGNLMQGGDKVTVAVKKVDEISTSVEITSISRGDLTDFGRSGRVVSTLFRKLDEALK